MTAQDMERKLEGIWGFPDKPRFDANAVCVWRAKEENQRTPCMDESTRARCEIYKDRGYEIIDLMSKDPDYYFSTWAVKPALLRWIQDELAAGNMSDTGLCRKETRL